MVGADAVDMTLADLDCMEVEEHATTGYATAVM